MWFRAVSRTSAALSFAHHRRVTATSVVKTFSSKQQIFSEPIVTGVICQGKTGADSTPSRRYATDVSEGGSIAGVLDSKWAEHEFVEVAESSLELIFETVSKYGFDSSTGPDDFDTDLSQGVLTLSLGSHGTYVLNTQTPNRQIWLSSPISGPWRYGWHPTRREWISSRDGHSLAQRLAEEFSGAFRQSIKINFGDVMK